jgi:DNA-binding NarL/FixJ family response regulator
MTYKVLIVDDSKLARMSIVKILASHYPDWPRCEAGNAEEAMKSTVNDAPDIALLDYNMPIQNGLDLAVELRKLKPSMPIAVISANHQQEVVHRAQTLRAFFLPKPLREEALKDFLDAAVQNLKTAAP